MYMNMVIDQLNETSQKINIDFYMQNFRIMGLMPNIEKILSFIDRTFK